MYFYWTFCIFGWIVEKKLIQYRLTTLTLFSICKRIKCIKIVWCPYKRKFYHMKFSFWIFSGSYLFTIYIYFTCMQVQRLILTSDRIPRETARIRRSLHIWLSTLMNVFDFKWLFSLNLLSISWCNIHKSFIKILKIDNINVCIHRKFHENKCARI